MRNLFFVVFLFLSFNAFGQNTFTSNNATPGSSFTTAGNWTCSSGPGCPAATPNFNNGLDTFIIRDGDDYVVDGNLDVFTITVGEGVSGVLNIGNDANIRSIILQGGFNVITGGSLGVNSNGVVHTLEVQGNITNDGTINLHNTILDQVALTLNGVGANLSYIGNDPILGNVTFKDAGVGNRLYTVNANLDIRGNVLIEDDATFVGGANTHTVNGSWQELVGGAYDGSGGGTVIFNNNLVQSLSSDGVGNNLVFENLTFNGGGVVSFGADVFADGTFTITNSTSITTGREIRSRGDFILDAGSSITQTANTTYFDGSAAQAITLDGTAVFNAARFDNGGSFANAKTIAGDLFSEGQFRIDNDAWVVSVSNIECTGFRVDNIDATSTQSLTGVITIDGGNVDFDGTGVNGTVDLSGADINITADVTIRDGDNLLTDDFSVTGAGVDFYISENSSLTGNASSLFTLNDDTRLHIQGASNFPGGFVTTNYTINSNSQIRYDGSIAQSVTADDANWDYGILLLSEANNKTATGDLNVLSTLFLRNDVVFDLDTYDITLGGTLDNDDGGSIIVDIASYGTFTFNGTDNNQTIETADGGTYTFGNLVINKPGLTTDRSFFVDDNFSFYGDWSVSNPAGDASKYLILDLNTYSFTYLGAGNNFDVGSFVEVQTAVAAGTPLVQNIGNLSALNFDNNGTIVEFNRNGNQDIPSEIVYRNVELSGGGLKTPNGPLDVNGDFSRPGGNVDFVDAGFSHTVAGDWNMDRDWTIMTGTMTFDGADQQISESNFNNVIHGGTGTKTIVGLQEISGDFTVLTGVAVSTNDDAINIQGNWDVQGTGSFVQASGTTTFNSTTADQTINFNTSSSFGNLTIIKTNNSFETVQLLSDVRVSGTFDLDQNDAVIDLQSFTLFIGDNFQYRTGTTVNSSGGSIHFNGDAEQGINNFNTAPLPSLIFTGTGEKRILQNTLDVDGDITIVSSTLDAANRRINISGNWSNTGTFQSTNRVTFDGADQNISASEFHDVYIEGTNTKTLTGNITLSGLMQIESGSTLDVSPSNYSITVEESWFNDGSFEARAGKVTFIGGSADLDPNPGGSGENAARNFYDIEFIISSTARIELESPLDVDNDFTISTGRFETDENDVFVGGNFVNNGTYTHNNDASLLTLNASAGTKIFIPGSSGYRSITIDATGVLYQLQSNLDMTIDRDHNLTINGGTLDLEGNTIEIPRGSNVNGVVIGASGTLDIDAGAALVLGQDALITNAGTFKVVGISGNPATMNSSDPDLGDYYTFVQTAGTFHAQHYIIQNTKGEGIDLQGGTIDQTDNFSNGIFSGGTGNQYLKTNSITISPDINPSTTIFNEGPTSNVQRTAGATGIITFSDYSGTLGGPTFEDDAGNLIDWDNSSLSAFKWDGGGDGTSWNDGNNWTGTPDNTIPSATDNVILDDEFVSSYTVDLNTTIGLAQTLEINENAGSVTLQVNGIDLDIADDFILIDGTLTHTGAASEIQVGGDWIFSSNGTFNNGTSTVVFDAAAGETNLISIAGSNGNFNNFEISGGDSDTRYVISSDIDIDGNFVQTEGLFDILTANTISVGGDWTKSGGIFNPGASIVNFNGSGTSTISGGNFHSVTFSGGGTKDLQSNISVENDLTISGGGTQVLANANLIFLQDNWTNNVGATGFVPGTGSVIFDGDGQNISGSGDTNFNTVFFSGNGNKDIQRNINIAGDWFISFANTAIVRSGVTVTGTGTGKLEMTNGTLQIEGINNFPGSFGTYNLNAGRVYYRADSDQTIFSTSYFDLTIDDANGAGPYTKTLAGDIIVNDDFVIGDGNDADNLVIDFAGFTTQVFDVFTVRAGNTLNWNGGTFIHFGAGFTIDSDISEFNNLILRGSGTKTMSGNLNITGDATLENGITLNMVTFTMIRTPVGGTFSMQGTATLNTQIPSATGFAFPTDFSSYLLANTSTVTLNGGADQDIFTGATYGNLNLVNGGNATILGGDLDVDGNFNMGSSPNLVDGGNNIFLGGADNDIRTYTATAATTITFNGTDQAVRNDENGGADDLNFSNVVFTGSGIKTLNGGQDTWNISENITIDPGVAVVLTRNMFAGGDFTNNGSFTHSANNLTFNSISSPVTIDFGSSNDLRNIQFSNAVTYNLVNNGMDLNNGFFVIDPTTTVDFGTLTHNLASTTHTFSGTVITASTNFNFDRTGGQTLPDITMEFLDLTLSGTGNKILEGDYTIDDLLVESGPSFLLSNDGGTTLGTLNVRGNWENQGTVNVYTTDIEFESNDGATKTINSGGNNFHNILFNQGETNTRTYQIVSNNLRILNSLTIGANATLDLNSFTLLLGNNDTGTPAGEQHAIQANGTLDVGPNGIIEFDGNDLDQRIQVDGTLRLVGSAGNLASIERNGGGSRIDIEIMSGGTIAAQFYQVQNISDAGLVVNSGATVDPTDNFSNGVWSGINTSGAGNYRYLQFDAPVGGSFNINNVTFNHGGTPVQGIHFNVGRAAGSTGTINFTGQSNGLLAGEFYEADDTGVTNPGLITWSVVSQVIWIGGVSSEWETGANWSGGVKPTSSDNVTIPLGQPNNPIIGTADAVCRQLTLTNGILTILSGYNLSITSDINIGTGASSAVLAVDQAATQITVSGSWDMNNNSIYTDNNSTILFNAAGGSVTFAPNDISSFSNVTFNGLASFLISGANIDVNGNLNLVSGTLSAITNNHEIFIAGDMTNTGGTVSSTSTGFIILDGGNQNITDFDFLGLRVEGTDTKTFIGTSDIEDELLVSSTIAASGGAVLNMMGDVTINPGGTFNDGNGTHTFSGATWTGQGSYVGNGIIQFNRNANQSINGGSFHTIEFSSNNQDKILLDDVSVTGDILLDATVDDFRANQSLLSGDGTGTFTAEGDVELFISGTDNFPSNFSTYSLNADTQTRYDGSSNQTIRGGLSYGNVILTNPNTKTLESSIAVQTDLNINDATLDAASFNIDVGDDFDNDDTGSFIAGTGTVRFNGTTPAGLQDIRLSQTGVKSFYNVVVDNDVGTVRQLFADLTVSNNFSISDGTYRIEDNDDELTVGNNITIQSGEVFQSRGTVRVTKGSGTSIITSGGSTFLDFIVDGNATFQLGDDFALNGNFTQNSGTFTLNGNTGSFGNSLDAVTISGIFNVSAGGRMELGNDVSVNVENSGTFNAVGAMGNSAVITRNGTSTYNFSIDGNIGAQYYTFEYMSANGIVINSSATINTTNNFSNGTFANGAAGGTYLRVENTQDLNGANRIENVNFSDDPGGGATNVTKLLALTGNLEFFDASGNLAGENFDNDPNDLIDWTGAETLTWNGLVSEDWFTAANWDSNLGGNKVPDGTQDLIVPAGTPNIPVINNALMTGLGKTLSINSGAFISIISNDAITDLDLSGDLNLDGIFSNSGSDVAIEVAGNWDKPLAGAVFSAGTSMVTLNSTTGSKTLNNGSSTFFDLIIDGTGGYILGASTTIVNDLVINSTLDMGVNTNDLTVGSDFTNSGTFISQNADLILNASDGLTKTITTGGATLYNVFIQPSIANTYQLADDLIANGDIVISTTTVDLSGNDVAVGSSVNSIDIQSGGTLDVGAGERILMGNSSTLQVSNGGRLNLNGTDAANIALVTRRTIGARFGFDVLSGGSIQADFYRVEYMDGNGLTVNNGATIEETSPGIGLTNGEFSNGASTTDSRYLTVLNNLGGGFTISTIQFISGPDFNVVRQSGTGVLTVEDGLGSLGGPTYEKDDEFPTQDAASGLVQWSFTVPVLTWEGTVSNDWDLIANWTPASGIPGSSTVVNIPAGVSFEPIISSSDALAGEINFQAGGNLTINTNRNLDVTNNIDFNGETFTVSSGSSSTIAVGGTILNITTSTIDFGNSSTVELASNSVANVTFSSDATQPFNNLSITGDAIYEPDASLDVNGALVIAQDGIVTGGVLLKLSTNQINVGGDITVGALGSLNTSGGNLILDGVNQAITIDGTASLTNLLLQGSGNKTLNDDLSFTDLTVNSGVTFTASGSVTIDVLDDWRNQGIFVPGSSTVRFIGSSLQDIENDGGGSFNNIVFNNNAPGANQFDLFDPMTINGTATFTDGIVLADDPINEKVTFNGDGSSAVGATEDSFIDGLVEKSGINNFTFPIGKNGIFARIAVEGLSATATFTAEYFGVAPINNQTTDGTFEYASGGEYWDLNRTAGTGDPFVRLYWEDGARSEIVDLADLIVAHYNGALWENKGGATSGAPAAGNVISTSALTAFSPVTFGSLAGTNPLPVELISFTAVPNQNVVDVEWSTASELNNDYFTVERSKDGRDFESVIEVPGKGDTGSITEYKVADERPYSGLSYYRLKQTDFDGTSTYSKIVSVVMDDTKTILSTSIYPNPFSDSFDLEIEGANEYETIYFVVTDNYGKQILRTSAEADSRGNASFEVNRFESFADGIYIINIITEKGTVREKVIKK